jgi:hypothetical protein
MGALHINSGHGVSPEQTNCDLKSRDYSKAASCKLQAASCKLQAASCKLQAASCKRASVRAGDQNPPSFRLPPMT